MVLGLACGRPHRVGTPKAEERFASAFTARYDYRKSACTVCTNTITHDGRTNKSYRIYEETGALKKGYHPTRWKS